MAQLFSRERRSWTVQEDQLLREAVQREDPDNSNPSKWHAIAKHVPNRTNKDCRKRWFAKMASDVVKGGWAPDEDEKLVQGIERYGTRWSLVASVVQTRNSDQCAKRWTDTLNPAIDRTTWTAEADELLLRAVTEHGKVWTKIVKTYFPGRTGLSAKNRYNSITRFNSDASRSGVRPRRKSDATRYTVSRKAESVSSSSSGSPSSPSMSLPFLSQSTYPSNFENKTYIDWSSSSSIATDDIPSFRSSPLTYDYADTSPSTPSESSYQSFDVSMEQHLNAFSDASQLVFPLTTTQLSQSTLYKDYPPSSRGQSQAFSTYSQYPLIQGSNDMADQFPLFDGLTHPLDAASLHWDALSSIPEQKLLPGGYKMPPTSDFPLRSH
ncbi:hypothetical protein BJ165DRAFT_1416881 [Panaeolus papilionaceus]|nr:hypothetical protein BJ165DRAFT_1416881 [Panaeolus papilionaceus]